MHALQRALDTVFGLSGRLDDIDFAGRTDGWIMRAVFRKFGLPASPENFERFFAGYAAELPAALRNPHARVLPGVREILAAVRFSDPYFAVLVLLVIAVAMAVGACLGGQRAVLLLQSSGAGNSPAACIACSAAVMKRSTRPARPTSRMMTRGCLGRSGSPSAMAEVYAIDG